MKQIGCDTNSIGTTLGRFERILILEDDEDAASILTQMLTLAGYQVRMTNKPQEFEAEYGAFGPDLLILDVFMPDRDGLEILESIGTHKFRCAVLLCSGFSPLYMEAALQLCRYYEIRRAQSLTKPFSRQDVLHQIQTLEQLAT